MRRTPMATGTEAPRKHGAGGFRSLILSMLVLVAVVFLWQALTPTVSKVDRPALDISVSADDVVRQTSWPILVPDLGPEWRATSVNFSERAGARTWEVGYVQPGDDSVFVSVAQTGELDAATSPAEWTTEFTRAGGQTGAVTIGEQTWTSYTASERNPRHSLVPKTQGEVAVVISGLGDPANLVAVAESLKPYQP